MTSLQLSYVANCYWFKLIIAVLNSQAHRLRYLIHRSLPARLHGKRASAIAGHAAPLQRPSQNIPDLWEKAVSGSLRRPQPIPAVECLLSR